MERPSAPPRSDFKHFQDIQTRWMDNDIYGHVNNVVYYSYFDTVVNQWLIENALLDMHGGDIIGLVVETRCAYFAPVGFPDALEAGLNVTRIGASSVSYEVGLFQRGAVRASAAGQFVHVYVDRAHRRPQPLTDVWRSALSRLTSET
jgi:acyl-CoA thioester hydrolase